MLLVRSDRLLPQHGIAMAGFESSNLKVPV
jgi:hypothetical protein